MNEFSYLYIKIIFCFVIKFDLQSDKLSHSFLLEYTLYPVLEHTFFYYMSLTVKEYK